MDSVDCIVVGAGVLGLAVARELAIRGREVVIIEANSMIGNETSSRNNEVVHAGFLYPPSSMRGQLCHAGAKTLLEYCQERNIEFSAWGKLVLAANEAEVKQLATFQEYGAACGVGELKLLTSEAVSELEPGIKCEAALYSPATAVVDTHALMLSFLGEAENAGAFLALNSRAIGGRVSGSDKTLIVENDDGSEFEIRWTVLINAAGLGARFVSQMFSDRRKEPVPSIYYAKGSFFSLTGRAPLNHIILPLGQTLANGGAFTIDPGGQGKFGPDVEWIREPEYTVNPENAVKFAAAVSAYWDGLDISRLQPGYAGVRPRTYNAAASQGDWIIETEDDHGLSGLVNLLGIETPGLTASMAVAGYVADKVLH